MSWKAGTAKAGFGGPEGVGARGGLEGVVVADTMLSRVDGANGRLVIRGLSLESVAGFVPFEAMATLLLRGELACEADVESLRARLGAARTRAFERLPELGAALSAPDGMEALRTALAHLRASAEPPTERAAAEAEQVEILGATAVLVAAWARGQGLGRKRGRGASTRDAVAPDPSLPHAEDYLRMLSGEAVLPALVEGLDTYLATVAEHGMNASTFAARVVASTGSDTVSSVVAALCALKGPLHGGAPGPVLDMLEEVGSPERARSWLEAELAAGRRIMGLGHRVYRVRDPRAAVLEGAIEALERAGISTQRLDLARGVEREAAALLRERHPGRPMEANVEFYTAVLLDTLGLDRRLFTTTFAVGRAAGWLAHIDEQRRTGRLIRPTCRYIGPLPEAA